MIECTSLAGGSFCVFATCQVLHWLLTRRLRRLSDVPTLTSLPPSQGNDDALVAVRRNHRTALDFLAMTSIIVADSWDD